MGATKAAARAGVHFAYRAGTSHRLRSMRSGGPVCEVAEWVCGVGVRSAGRVARRAVRRAGAECGCGVRVRSAGAECGTRNAGRSDRGGIGEADQPEALL